MHARVPIRVSRARTAMATTTSGGGDGEGLTGQGTVYPNQEDQDSTPAKFSSLPVEDRGGYDCEFVEPPPAAFQTECPICLHVLREPCLISCPCGQKICRECVEQIKKVNKPCPLCNKTDFTFLRDYGLERSLKEFEVWCISKKAGCDWKGKLGEYEQHLNRNPSPENQLTGCQFVEVECKHGCGERFQRRYITSHQNKQCRMRPYSCEYCHDCDSTFEDVTVTHYPECKKYPVSCPNGCQENLFERQELETHLKEECPLTEVNCPLHYAGCEVRLPRKDMPEHMKDMIAHLTLLATVTQTLQKENQELRREVKDLNVQKLGLPVEYRVRKSEDTVYLPSFFTHSHGYQMSISIDFNGVGEAKGTHMSLFAYLMQGKYDDHLKWPFRGEITIQIVNQAGDTTHSEQKISYNDKTPVGTADRVIGKKSATGWGFRKFLAHTDLEYNAERNTQYMKDDIIIVRVVKVFLS